MIISASRRTDIPAFYSKWFMNRLREGFVMVRNPINRKLISKVSLAPSLIECIVFWTKNPRPLFEHLDEISKDYKFYFQYTLNPYDIDLEPNIESLNRRLDTFIELSNKIGAKRVIWRYDPIIITDKYTINWHIEKFDELCQKLCKYTNICVFSFVDLYEKILNKLKEQKFHDISENQMLYIAKEFSKIAEKYNLELKTCSENITFESVGIRPSCCVDPYLIEELISDKLIVKKDPNQRKSCGCIESIDIGEYDSCMHGCIYCYANSNRDKHIDHNNNSPLLIGKVNDDDIVKDRQVKSFRNIKISLF